MSTSIKTPKASVNCSLRIALLLSAISFSELIARDADANSLFFYDASKGLASTAFVNDDGSYHSVIEIPGFATGWTHIVATNNGSMLFYNAESGLGATATLDGVGNYKFVRALPGFATGWTHIVSASDSALLFYNASTGLGATATLDSEGNYQFVRTLSGFATGWTHIVGTNCCRSVANTARPTNPPSFGNGGAVSDGGILFYNASTGLAGPFSSNYWAPRASS